MTTEYGFDFGPLKVERTWGDPQVGYGIQVTVGKRLLSIEATPRGRKAIVREYVGGTRWRELQ